MSHSSTHSYPLVLKMWISEIAIALAGWAGNHMRTA